MVKTIVFDFDGVLVDSNRMKKEIFRELLARDARVVAAADSIPGKFLHKTRMEALREISVKLGESPAFINSYNERYNRIVIDGIKNLGLLPGVRETLEELRGRYALYLNSATPTEPLRMSADVLGITDFFRGIYGAEGYDSIPDTKDKNLKIIMKSAGASADELFFVGDGEADLAAARKCGCGFAGIPNEFNGWQGTREFKTIASVRGLPVCLQEL